MLLFFLKGNASFGYQKADAGIIWLAQVFSAFGNMGGAGDLVCSSVLSVAPDLADA